MRVLLIGATGLIGSAVRTVLEAAGHEVVGAGHSSGNHRVDMGDPDSVEALYREAGALDAVVVCAGSARFGTVQDLEPDDYTASMADKFMGQVHVTRIGARYLERGSITLTSGTLAENPIPASAAVAAVSGAVESFAKGAALDLAPLRVNVVSPGWIKETLESMGKDPEPGAPVAEVARGYLRAVEGEMTGRVLHVGE